MRIGTIFIMIGICFIVTGNEMKYAEKVNKIIYDFEFTHGQNFKEVRDLVSLCNSSKYVPSRGVSTVRLKIRPNSK